MRFTKKTIVIIAVLTAIGLSVGAIAAIICIPGPSKTTAGTTESYRTETLSASTEDNTSMQTTENGKMESVSEELTASRLTPEAVREIFLDANNFCQKWVLQVDLELDTENRIEIDNNWFYPVLNNEFADVDAVCNGAYQYFTDDTICAFFDPLTIQDIINRSYRMYNNKLVGTEYQAGDAPPTTEAYLHITSQTADECCFTITEWNNGFNPGDRTESNTYTYKLIKNQNGNWVFTGSFHDLMWLTDAWTPELLYIQ